MPSILQKEIKCYLRKVVSFSYTEKLTIMRGLCGDGASMKARHRRTI
jgi:hypothetical protein